MLIAPANEGNVPSMDLLQVADSIVLITADWLYGLSRFDESNKAFSKLLVFFHKHLNCWLTTDRICRWGLGHDTEKLSSFHSMPRATSESNYCFSCKGMCLLHNAYHLLHITTINQCAFPLRFLLPVISQKVTWIWQENVLNEEGGRIDRRNNGAPIPQEGESCQSLRPPTTQSNKWLHSRRRLPDNILTHKWRQERWGGRSGWTSNSVYIQCKRALDVNVCGKTMHFSSFLTTWPKMCQLVKVCMSGRAKHDCNCVQVSLMWQSVSCAVFNHTILHTGCPTFLQLYSVITLEHCVTTIFFRNDLGHDVKYK